MLSASSFNVLLASRVSALHNVAASCHDIKSDNSLAVEHLNCPAREQQAQARQDRRNSIIVFENE